MPFGAILAAVRAKGGGGFNPKQLPGLEIWLDSQDKSTLFQDSAKTTPVVNDADSVGAWADKSGNGVDFVQATAGKILKYNFDKNGIPVVRCHTTNYALSATVTARTHRTVFLIFKSNVMCSEAPRTIWGMGDDVQIYMEFLVGAGLSYSYNSSWGGTSFGGELFFDIDCVTLAINGNSDLKIYNNGVLGASLDPIDDITTYANMTLGNNKNGGTNNMPSCDFYGMLSYSRVLSTSEQAQVLNYLRGHYRMTTLSQYWDTIWTRQTALAASVPEDDSSIQEPTVFYDSNPQILAGPNVYKMWHTYGWTNLNTGYAESADGISWTRKSGAILPAGYARNFVLKVASTYYLYGWHSGGGLDVFTSTDGITWTLQGSNIIGWTGVSNTCVFVDTDGVWKMLYEKDSPGVLWLSTSADGITWRAQASNVLAITKTVPRLSSVGGPSLYKIGSVYYVVVHVGDSGGLPCDIKRYKSLDLINWTDLGYFLLRAEADEGYGVGNAQVADPCLVHVGNQIYLYYSATTNGNLSTGNMHVKLATCSDEWLTRES